MSSRDRIFVSAVFLLLTCVFLLSAPETGYTQDGSSCCIANLGPGCDDQACQDAVCAADDFCCNTSWDEKCAVRAQELCGNLCIGVFNTVPTLNEWGLIALAGVLGLFSLVAIRRRYALHTQSATGA